MVNFVFHIIQTLLSIKAKSYTVLKDQVSVKTTRKLWRGKIFFEICYEFAKFYPPIAL